MFQTEITKYEMSNALRQAVIMQMTRNMVGTKDAASPFRLINAGGHCFTQPLH